jgi:PAS domain S-box-containing protein
MASPLNLNSRLLSFYRSASRAAGGIVFAVGFLVLAGWLFDIPALKSIFPGFATMKANTALAFMLAGSSLWLASTRGENQRIDLLAKACATVTMLIGLLTLSEYLFSRDLGIDQLLFKDPLTPESAHPGRLSLVTALNFSLLGLALLFPARHAYRRLVEVFSITALLISVLALMGYVYGVSSLYQFFPYSSVAIHTALAFSILCVGILFAQPGQGLMKVFSSDSLGGLMARRLTPAALVIPFLLGWLFLTGQRMGHYDSTLRLVLSSMSTVIIFAVLILWNASLLQRTDLVRQQTQTQLSRSEERKATILDSSLDAIISIDHIGQVLEFNPAAQKIFGYTEAEVLGKEMSQLIIPPSLRERHRTGLANYLATGEGPVLGKRIEMNGMRADGTEFPVELTVTLNEGGGLPVFTGFVRDITQRKQAEKTLRESEERFRLVVQAAPSAMIAADREGKINMVNVRAQELFGYPEEELLGRPIEMLVPQRFRSGHGRYRQSFLAQPTSRPMGAGRDLFGLHKDGHEIPIEIGLTPYESSEGPFTLALIVDITERKQAEKVLKASEERFRLIVEAAPSAIIAVDSEGKINLVNAKAQELFGYPPQELLRRPVEMLVPERFRTRHPNYRQGFVAKPSRRAMGAGRNLYGLHKDGHEVPIEIGLTPYESSEGQFTLALIVDITERSQAEEKIAYQAYLLENVNDAIIGSDENSVLTFWNRAAERMFGWKAEEVLGRSGREILRSEFIDTDRETVLKMLAEHGRWKGESVLYRKDGSQVMMEASTITLRDANGLITGYVSVYRDITERKQAEERLQANAARALLIAELSQGFAELTDDYQRLLDLAARRIAELIGDYCAIRLVRADNVTLQLVVDHHLDASAHEFMHQLVSSIPQRMDEGITAQVYRSGKAVLLPFVSPDAFRAQVKSEFHPLLERLNIHSILIAPLRAEGKIIGTITMLRDQTPHAYTEDDQIFLQDLADRIALAIVTARLYTATRQLNAELEQRVSERTAALSQANSLLQMMLDHMPDQIYFKDAQSRFIRNSRSQARALGLSDPAEVVGKSDFDFFPHAQLSYEKEQEIIRSGKPLVDEEEHIVWPDGRETWVSTTKIPLPDQDGQIIGTFGISRDITERKRAEVALQKAKLELEAANKELEAFSYSVSHDLRSPLRSIDGFSQALLEDYADQLPAEGQNHLKRVRAATQRMAELIDDLLNLSKVTRASMKLVPVDLSQLAQRIATELQRTQPERRLNFNITPNLKARGDPSLLQAVLENLLNNAWKFTSKREQAEIEFGSKHENDEAVYFIRDNGAGFDMAYVGKLFGAFQRLHAMTEFSGTGIGLATVQRIIHRHGGRIWAEGAVDQGATFFFTLPALERPKPETLPQEKDSLARRAREII